MSLCLFSNGMRLHPNYNIMNIFFLWYSFCVYHSLVSIINITLVCTDAMDYIWFIELYNVGETFNG